MDYDQSISKTLEGIQDIQKNTGNKEENLKDSNHQMVTSNESVQMSDEKDKLNKDVNNINVVSDSRVIEGTGNSVNVGANSVEQIDKNDMSSDLINNCVEESSNDNNITKITNELSEKISEVDKNIDKDLDFSRDSPHLPSCQTEPDTPQTNEDKPDNVEILDDTAKKFHTNMESSDSEADKNISEDVSQSSINETECMKENLTKTDTQSEPVDSSENVCGLLKNIPDSSDLADSTENIIESNTSKEVTTQFTEKVDSSENKTSTGKVDESCSSENEVDSTENQTMAELTESPNVESTTPKEDITDSVEETKTTSDVEKEKITEVKDTKTTAAEEKIASEEMETTEVEEKISSAIEKEKITDEVADIEKISSEVENVKTTEVKKKIPSEVEKEKVTSEVVETNATSEVEAMETEPILDKTASISDNKDVSSAKIPETLQIVSEKSSEPTDEPMEISDSTNVGESDKNKKDIVVETDKMEVEIIETPDETSKPADEDKSKDGKDTDSTSTKEVSTIDTDDGNTSESTQKSTDIADTERTTPSDTLNEIDERSMEENPVFVHVSSKNDKNSPNPGPEPTEDSLEDSLDVENITEEDPIGVSSAQIDKDDAMEFDSNLEKQPMKVVDKNVIEDLVSGKGADEELCIIPDTEREISQEEKDAATRKAAAPKSPSKPSEKSDDGKPAEEVQKDTEPIEASNVTEKSKEKNKTIHEEESHTSCSMKISSISEDKATRKLCHQCNSTKKCFFTLLFESKDIFICSDTCLKSFKALNSPKPASKVAEIKIRDMSSAMNKDVRPIAALQSQVNKVFVRQCAECFKAIKGNNEKLLTWETMEYCNEECLAKYQTKIGSTCASCKKGVVMSSLGKYCVRFGHDIRQFCSSMCLEEFKKGLKVCSYCQKDISSGQEGFLAPIGDKGQFKDFCSQHCMENFESMNNKHINRVAPDETGVCSVCMNEKKLCITFEQLGNKQKFCSEPCFVAFKFVNNVDPMLCDLCKKYFETMNSAEFSMQTDTGVKNFCCKTCQNIYIIANRRIVPCSWCKVKKYHFDMIKKVCLSGQILNMCSLNCLSLFQVSINAVNSKKSKCDLCLKMTQAQYHLTMSDATLRNFCSYQCVVSFQNQFPTTPIPGERNITVGTPTPTTNIPIPTPTGPPRRTYMPTRRQGQPEPQAEHNSSLVITKVQSLASNTPVPQVDKSTYQRECGVQVSVPVPPLIKHQVIMRPRTRPELKNKSTSVKPIMKNVAIECQPKMVNKEIQTDPIPEKVRIIPVPVPIYVPSPLQMFTRPLPVPVPFPLPIPIPVFIPTTRNSAAGIMKEIKKIQVKIPSDPFEAELLMMAEMVAGEKKIDNTDSESDDDDHHGGGAAESYSPEAVDNSNTFGEDMLQMALKMATELDEPAVDLEGALTANTITASQNTESTPGVEESVDDPQPMHPHHAMLDRNAAMRGRKRQMRSPRGGSGGMVPSKRGRRMSSSVDMPMMPPPQPQAPPEPVEKPDANMCLKYTFGVNAWKQWVTTKNAELEKSSRRMKLFKNEILQLTADELNYSLCLFVKEVRKPNGTEYAPDTIYYLCLGIQQYLFENGRIDNIFTDAYYEKFTDCLDEVAKKFSVLYNDSHYIVTRVEEEHLWESKQLGAHSPHVLLSTLMFFNTKHFNLTSVDEHMQLSFSHIMKHWKRNPNQPGAAKVPGSRNVLLRFYPPQTTLDNNIRKKKVYEQQENEENPLRCPVKLYEFYLSKCPESVKTRNDVFYLLPERSCVPDSPVWYSTMALGREALEKMLHRVKMVKEINVALLAS